MLIFPDSGFTRSVSMHNVDLILASDWVEASLLFSQDTISKSEIVDIFCEMQVYVKQDLASAFVENIWSQLTNRARIMGVNSAYKVESKRLTRIKDWKEVAELSFCLILTLASMYKSWAKKAKAEYIRQGFLFERLAYESLMCYGWNVLHTGWSSGIQHSDFETIVQNVADYLNENYTNSELVSLYKSANEKGLDLVCYKPFMDNQGGRPLYLIQCASGKYWEGKLGEPDLKVWKKLIQFSNTPLTGIVCPYTFDDKKFYQVATDVDGIVLDRYRLLGCSPNREKWLSSKLSKDIIKWIKPKVRSLPIEAAHETA